MDGPLGMCETVERIIEHQIHNNRENTVPII